jgi:hypothetical protein
MVVQEEVHPADQPTHEPVDQPDTDAIVQATRQADVDLARAVYDEIRTILQWFRTAPGPQAIELCTDNWGTVTNLDLVPKYILAERIRHAEEYIAKSNRLAELITIRAHCIKFHLSHLAIVPMPVVDAIITRGVNDEIVCAHTPNGAEPARE